MPHSVNRTIRDRLRGRVRVSEVGEWALAELQRTTRAGDQLAVAAAHVATEYDGVHRLRAALAGWYDARAGIHGHR